MTIDRISATKEQLDVDAFIVCDFLPALYENLTTDNSQCASNALFWRLKDQVDSSVRQSLSRFPIHPSNCEKAIRLLADTLKQHPQQATDIICAVDEILKEGLWLLDDRRFEWNGEKGNELSRFWERVGLVWAFNPPDGLDNQQRIAFLQKQMAANDQPESTDPHQWIEQAADNIENAVRASGVLDE